jgi:hypothetical protein
MLIGKTRSIKLICFFSGIFANSSIEEDNDCLFLTLMLEIPSGGMRELTEKLFKSALHEEALEFLALESVRLLFLSKQVVSALS